MLWFDSSSPVRFLEAVVAMALTPASCWVTSGFSGFSTHVVGIGMFFPNGPIQEQAQYLYPNEPECHKHMSSDGPKEGCQGRNPTARYASVQVSCSPFLCIPLGWAFT